MYSLQHGNWAENTKELITDFRESPVKPKASLTRDEELEIVQTLTASLSGATKGSTYNSFGVCKNIWGNFYQTFIESFNLLIYRCVKDKTLLMLLAAIVRTLNASRG